MESGKTFRFERGQNEETAKLFFENSVLPYLSEMDKSFFTTVEDSGFSAEYLRKEYEKFSSFDPDKYDTFFESVLVPFYIIASSEDGSAFAGVHGSFIEKSKKFAEKLYRDAFFRNRYDSIEAWESCHKFKEYQPLFQNLNILPDGARERISGMSKELDALWSQPEIEKAFATSRVSELVDSGVSENSMLVKIFKGDTKPMPEAEYDHYHNMRPDLFPPRYEDYLQELEEPRHPYVLKL